MLWTVEVAEFEFNSGAEPAKHQRSSEVGSRASLRGRALGPSSGSRMQTSRLRRIRARRLADGWRLLVVCSTTHEDGECVELACPLERDLQDHCQRDSQQHADRPEDPAPEDEG